MTIEATFEFVPAGVLTAARVDFDEPAGTGPTNGVCANDPRNGGLKLGVRVRVRKPGDAASRHLLEIGTCWPAQGCGWFAYATLTPESSGVPEVIAVEPLGTVKRSARMLGVRRWSPTHPWHFRNGSEQFGPDVLSSEWTEVEWVRMFVQTGAADDGSSVDAAAMFGRQGQAFSSLFNWSAGWPASLTSDSVAACGEALIEAASKAAFTVSSGDCTSPTPPDEGVFPTIDASPPPLPPTPYEARFGLDDQPDRFPDGGVPIPEPEG